MPQLPTAADVDSQALPSTRSERGSGVHRIEMPTSSRSAEADWDRLVEVWEERGYGDAPPKCMGEYADALIEALES